MKESKIKEQAKKIMDDFLAALKGMKEETHFVIRREDSMREKEQYENTKEFRDGWFRIAPKKQGAYILAEKGSFR